VKRQRGFKEGHGGLSQERVVNQRTAGKPSGTKLQGIFTKKPIKKKVLVLLEAKRSDRKKKGKVRKEGNNLKTILTGRGREVISKKKGRGQKTLGSRDLKNGPAGRG